MFSTMYNTFMYGCQVLVRGYNPNIDDNYKETPIKEKHHWHIQGEPTANIPEGVTHLNIIQPKVFMVVTEDWYGGGVEKIRAFDTKVKAQNYIDGIASDNIDYTIVPLTLEKNFN